MARNRLQLRAVENCLKDWYGNADARGELQRWLPSPQPIQNELEKIKAKFAQSRPKDIAIVLQMWSDFVGPKLAKYSRPIAFREKQIVVEYDRAAFLHELIRIKPTAIRKIQETFGMDFCTGMWLINQGSDPNAENLPQS